MSQSKTVCLSPLWTLCPHPPLRVCMIQFGSKTASRWILSTLVNGQRTSDPCRSPYVSLNGPSPDLATSSLKVTCHRTLCLSWPISGVGPGQRVYPLPSQVGPLAGGGPPPSAPPSAVFSYLKKAIHPRRARHAAGGGAPGLAGQSRADGCAAGTGQQQQQQQ